MRSDRWKIWKQAAVISLVAAAALAGAGCQKAEEARPVGTEAAEILPVQAARPVPETVEPAATEVQEPLPVSPRYLEILSRDCSVYENSRIFYQGKVYVYRGVEAPTDAANIQEVGQLVYDGTLASECSTDWEGIAGCSVSHLSGGQVTADALLVATAQWPGILYDPQEVVSGGYQYRENEDGSLTVLKYWGKESHVAVPSEIDGKRVTALGGGMEGVFSSCHSVVCVTVPEGVTIVNDNAFYGCDRLEEVSFPASLTGVGHCAFNLCPSLQRLTFAGDAPVTGNYLFDADIAGAGVRLCYPSGTGGWDQMPWGQFPAEGS